MTKPFIIIAAILAVSAAAIIHFEMEPPSVDKKHGFARRIPLEFGEWKGEELPNHPDVIRILRTDDLLMRIYTGSAKVQVVFAAVFAENDRSAAHPPEICFQGQGWSIEGYARRTYPVSRADFEPGETKLEKIAHLDEPANFTFSELIIRRGADERQLVHYWYKTGPECSSSLIAHEWQMLINNLRGHNTTNSLLRVSTNVRSSRPEDIQAARELVTKFCQDIYPYTLAAMP